MLAQRYAGGVRKQLVFHIHGLVRYNTTESLYGKARNRCASGLRCYAT